MIFKLLKLNISISDSDFNSIYSEPIQQLAQKHWTPVWVAKVASEFLVTRPGTRVLDIGSGVGKFCLVGAACTNGHFTGVEQRQRLVYVSQRLAVSYRVSNVEFVQANIADINFGHYDAFYFYNPFHENIDPANRIDDAVTLDIKLYHDYTAYVVKKFFHLPVGSRLVTFCSSDTLVPRSFKLQDSLHGGLLKFWEKVMV